MGRRRERETGRSHSRGGGLRLSLSGESLWLLFFVIFLMVFRYALQGGNNAGHTVIVGDTSYDFHLLPR